MGLGILRPSETGGYRRFFANVRPARDLQIQKDF